MSDTVRVLVVDDEPDIETLIRRRFKRSNGSFEFLFARNGKEALERVAADPSLDLIVTDINMPVMDGLALLGRLGEMDNRITRTIILSAYGDMHNIRTAMNRGAFDFLIKPLDFADFETTLQRTREAIDSARQAAAARTQLETIQQELEIAARIQAAILPREFCPGREDFGIYAEMTPARVVGGDFYDFFFVDPKRLGFLIGDVSGKGIPAALFMAVSRTLLQAVALQSVPPDECLRYANQVLGRQGEPGVYVTVFYGILHTDTGLVEYGLGGHNPPYRIGSTGELNAIDEPGGVVVGLLPESTYETGRLQLAPGESIFLFTDGVTEAMDPQQHFYTEKRLKEVLRGCGGLAPKETVSRVLAALGEFTAGAPQSDDITAMAVKWNGAKM
jgi:sigma-B regulation protein RsbU (phosphoserine phosphatase)